MINKVHGIMFHHFHDDKKHIRIQGSLSQEQFRKMLIFLKSNHNIVSAQEWLIKSHSADFDDRDICITFDDNLLCQFDIALPVLDEFDIKAFWFIYSSPLIGVVEKLEIYRHFRSNNFHSINEFYNSFNTELVKSNISKEVEDRLKSFNAEKYLSEYPFYSKEDKVFRYIRDIILGQERYYQIMDNMINGYQIDISSVAKKLWMEVEEIRYLDDTGHVIGLHSHTHPTSLNALPYKEQLAEYTKNHEVLSSILDHEITSMSHPNNSYNETTIRILENMSIQIGFRSDTKSGYKSKFDFPRVDHAKLIKSIV